MQTSQEMTGAVDFVDSMNAVAVGAERKHFQATYDSTRDSPSLAVVAVVATALRRGPQELTPLQSVLDTDALDVLTTESADGKAGCNCVTFCYEGVEVTVSGEEVTVAKTE